MAQGQATTAESAAFNSTDLASAKELKALQEYGKITQLRDAVLSGKHPTIKLPQGVAASVWSPSSSREVSRPQSAAKVNSATQKPATADAISSNPQPASAPRDATQSSYEARTADINPLFLQKSDELIKAEFRVTRKRLEQALAEESDKHRSKQDFLEMYTDADLSLIILKALDVVQAANPAPAATATAGSVTANDEAGNDSFDSDTFYSSKHPTPESNLTSRVRNESEEARPHCPAPIAQYAPVPSNEKTPSYDRGQAAIGSNHVLPLQSFHVQPTVRPQEREAVSLPFQVPGLNNYTKEENQSKQPVRRETVEDAVRTMDPSLSHSANDTAHKNAQEVLDDSYVENYPPSPLVRSHDRPPAAPQPTATQPSAVGETLPTAAELGVGIPQAPPAQVAALRNKPVSVDSPESSPQSGKEKKKGKKKNKRKADRQAPEDVMPEIKPEPRSVSPMTAPDFIRPKKRQKQMMRSGNNSDQEEVMITGPPQPHQHVRYHEPAPGYADPYGYPRRAASAAIVPAPRYDGGYAPEPVYAHQPSPTQYIERPPSAAYTRLPSHAVAHDGYADPQPVYRERYETSRMSVRPDTDPYIGQPMPPPPQRIFVDSSGREYLEPSRPPARQSVAPPSHPREVVYEQPPPRAVSRYPNQAPYDQNREVMYAQPPSGYSAPRRVVTQPEYASRSYAEPPAREYSARPGGPPTEYVRAMPPPTPLQGGAPPGDYTRAGSMRPAETVRYDYGSARPDGASHAGANPDPYRMVEYMPRPPPELPAQYRAYSVQPPPNEYYEQAPAGQGQHVSYVDRPGGTPQGVVYANGGPREMYR